MYGKSLAAVAYALVLGLQAALDDGHVDGQEWVAIAIAVTTAVTVYIVPITSQYKWIKTGVAFVLALLQGLSTVVINGWDPRQDWPTLIIAVVGALAILLAPATTLNPSGTGNVSVPFGADR